MKALVLLLPVVAVLLISGCTVPGLTPVTPTGTGVTIDAFEPDFSDVFSREPVQLQLKVSNTGSVDASDVKPSIQGIGTTDWDVNLISSGCGSFGLLAPDPARGTSGGTKTCIWSLKAPSVPKGLSTTYNPQVRLDYAYESTTVKSITLLPLAEARRLQNLGQQLPAETVSSTAGPIQLTITTKGPIRVFESNLEFPLEIKIQNVGGGTVCDGECDSTGDNWNKLPYTINTGDMNLVDCQASGTIALFKGQTNTITCTVQVQQVPENQIQKQVTVSAGRGTNKYHYFIDRSTSIKVTGV